jgi:aspartyl-tRNA(Asn)/glutamyl-tRNA(Gln) amidotransferase subunit C
MLTIKEVEHIAELARLELTEKEKEMFLGQLSAILDYVEKLNKVNTDGVEETSQVTGLINAIREDKEGEASKELINDILDNAPDKEEGLFRVKSVFE